MTAPAAGPLAALPQVDAIVRHPALAEMRERVGHAATVDAVRAALAAARTRVRDGAPPPDAATLAAEVNAQLAADAGAGLRRVLNATGVILHTNLGRAPLSDAARRAVADAAGYTTLEYDLAAGARGSRTAHLGALAAELCGTPAATVVNNGAGALVLLLAAIAHGREVVVSRGELVEIGGSYRLPEVMAAAGVRLREVGTTNRTGPADYAQALGADTALLLKVHRSNFAIVGFTAETSLGDLVDLGARHGVPVVHDLGSGLLRRAHSGPLRDEPSVADGVDAGVDAVVFSGDKLLGGPQAGVIAGSEELVARCRRHPLARALRVDKLQRAALEATFAAYRHHPAPTEIPTVRMLHAEPAELQERARRLAGALGDGVRVVETAAVVGGGALPGATLPSWGLALAAVDGLVERLRAGDPPVIGRVEQGRLVLDLRTLTEDEDGVLLAALRAARA